MQESILKKVYESTVKFLTPLNTEDTYKIVVEEGIRLNKATYGSLVFYENDEFIEVYSNLPIRLKRRKNGFTYKAYKENKSYVLYGEKFGKFYPKLIDLGLQSIVFIPISYKKKSMGVLIINSMKKTEYTKDQLAAFDLFGSLASLALRKTQLYDETKQAVMVRDRFISLAAHELRTPLTSVRGYAQLLVSKFKDQDSKEALWIQQLSYESLRLSNLINELLEINKVKSGRLEYYFKECQMSQILQRVFNNFYFVHPQHKIKFIDKILDGKDEVIGDFDKLIQVLTNILDNAAKYSPTSKPIEITSKITNSDYTITIKDKGEGISPDELPKLMKDLYKNPNNTKSGLGLGLFFSKEIIQRHHGDLKISSKIKKGTEVKIRLPLNNG